MVTGGRPNGPCTIHTRSAPLHPLFAIVGALGILGWAAGVIVTSKHVLTPLPRISQHVEEPKGIGLFLTYGVGVPELLGMYQAMASREP